MTTPTDPTPTLADAIDLMDCAYEGFPSTVRRSDVVELARRYQDEWHAERQRLTEELAAQKRCDAYNSYERSTLYKERDTLRARVAELEDRLTVAAPMRCPECGPHVAIDDDGWCATCGADTTYICPPEKGTDR